jgi:hypothetical protein
MDNKKTTKTKPLAVLRRKGDLTFTHHLFRLEPAEMRMNVSWKKYQPRLIEMSHGHIYHSVNDRNGKANQYCSPTGGHFHEIITEWGVDEAGNEVLIKAECGPAMEKKKFKNRSGTQSSKDIPVKFETEEHDRFITDDHKHEVSYVDTEEINPVLQKRRQEEDRAKISHMTRGARPQVTQVDSAAATSAGMQET